MNVMGTIKPLTLVNQGLLAGRINPVLQAPHLRFVPVAGLLPSMTSKAASLGLGDKKAPRVVAPLWRSKTFPSGGARSIRSAASKANIVAPEVLQLRTKASVLVEGVPSYASSKADVFRPDPKKDIFVQVYNQPDNAEFVIVTVAVDIQEAAKMGLLKKSTDAEGKPVLGISEEAPVKIYVELGEGDVSFDKTNQRGRLLILPIQVPFSALEKKAGGRFGFKVVIDGVEHPFEVGYRSHDAMGF